MDEVVIGMPHRGRLNVLANIVGKPISQIFREFEGNLDPGQAHGSGDVKYHLGAEGKYFRMFGDGETVVSLASNPSPPGGRRPGAGGHRPRQAGPARQGRRRGYTVLPLMLHGDAAFAGQGVVAETLNLALLRGYRTGGTVHVVVNNQVGFTTAPEHSRSSTYSTDVAKMIGAPVFHVNGDDPEACVWVAKLAVEYRERWHNDVVIDMVCYRRRGHNEGDDPSMTQPAMYDVIDAQAQRPQALHRVAHRPRRHLHGGRRARPARLLQPAGARVQRGPRAGADARRGSARRSRTSSASPPTWTPRSRWR